MDPMAFYCYFLSELCYGKFQSEFPGKEVEKITVECPTFTCSIVLRIPIPSTGMNANHCVFTVQLLMESVCKGEHSSIRLIPLHICKPAGAHFSPTHADLSSSLSLLLRLCCLDFAAAD